MKKGLYILLVCVACHLQAQVYSTRTYGDNIRTLRAQTQRDAERKADGEHILPMRPILLLDATHPDGIEGSDPENTLEISFDEMSHDTHLYTYTVVHLNADNTASDLLSNEYLQGFATQDITDYEHSLNTQRLYTHYSFTFPNPEMVITRSGNYAILVYEDNDKDKLVATQLVYVTTDEVDIRMTVRGNTNKEINGHYQQLDIDVSPMAGRQSSTTDLASDYFIYVEQNGRADNMVRKQRTNFLESGRLRFVDNKELIFEGGHEYHHFDTYSTYFAGEGVEQIWYENGDYHAMLPVSPSSEYVTYMHRFDTNGQRVVNAERTDYDDTEAEYMWVYFSLSTDRLWPDGQVYVGGDVFENRITADNRMTYDAEQHCYFLPALIKQGGVDYQYWFVPKGQTQASVLRTEGSHYETRNEYTVYVYYRPFGARADQLVGIAKVHGH